MRIMGIDPGSRSTGYAVIDVDGSVLKLLGMGVIKNGDTALHERIRKIALGVDELIEEFQPGLVVVETPYWGKGAQSSMMVAEVRGAILASAARKNVQTEGIAPARVKKAVTGRGQATKEQVEFMVKRMVGISGDIKPKDASDALAVAIAYSHRLGPGGIKG